MVIFIFKSLSLWNDRKKICFTGNLQPPPPYRYQMATPLETESIYLTVQDLKNLYLIVWNKNLLKRNPIQV